jgi:L-galactose dehydrogenase
VQAGKMDPGSIDMQDPLGFVTRDSGIQSIMDAAYRFCRDEPGIHVVLSGTGNVAHLNENIASMQRPPLPNAIRERLVQMFREVDTVSGH